MTKFLTLGVVTLVATTLDLSAQFHTQQAAPTGARAGRAIVNQNAVNATQRQAAAMSQRNAASMNQQGAAAVSGGDMILSDAQRQALSRYNPQIRHMQGKVVEVWGRGIHHADGSFTESKQDAKTKTLEQITRKNDVILQRRMIMLDQRGNPSEVMIYDGRGQFKYRGVMVYDTFGRFAEEQIYDPKGTLIRRKVQEYTPQGGKLPVRSWDYVDNIPPDLRLVITRENQAQGNQPGNGQENKSEKRGWFGGDKSNQSTSPAVNQTRAPAPPQNDGVTEQPQNYNAAASPPAKRKGLNLGRLFSKKK